MVCAIDLLVDGIFTYVKNTDKNYFLIYSIMPDVRQTGLRTIKINIHLHCESMYLLLHEQNTGFKGTISGLIKFLATL